MGEGENGDLRFRTNTPDVMHETIDGEVIAINLVSGNYYSFRGTGAQIWTLVDDLGDLSVEEIVEALELRFESPRSELENAVSRFPGPRGGGARRRRGDLGRARREPGANRTAFRSCRSKFPESRSTRTCRTSSCSIPCTRSTIPAGRGHVPMPPTMGNPRSGSRPITMTEVAPMSAASQSAA